MTVLQLDLRVSDYGEWKRLFDEDPADRGGSGVRRHHIYRCSDEPGHVVVHLEFDGAEQAQAMRGALVDLWERLGSEILEQATAHVLEVQETRDYDGS
jgi:hypothetical protein